MYISIHINTPQFNFINTKSNYNPRIIKIWHKISYLWGLQSGVPWPVCLPDLVATARWGHWLSVCYSEKASRLSSVQTCVRSFQHRCSHMPCLTCPVKITLWCINHTLCHIRLSCLSSNGFLVVQISTNICFRYQLIFPLVTYTDMVMSLNSYVWQATSVGQK